MSADSTTFEGFKPEDSAAVRRTINDLTAFIVELVKEKYSHLVCELGHKVAPYDGNAYVFSHNASWAVNGSYALAASISEHLKAMKLPKCSVPYTLEIVVKFKKAEAVNKETPSAQTTETQENAFKLHASKPLYNLSQIILPTEVKQQVTEAIAIVKHRKLIFNDWGFRSIEPVAKSVINLYGPPGSGKTMLAHCIASELKRDILACNYAEIESKYVGDSAKNLMAAFEAAKETNAVLFFDEADSFLGKRIENVSHGSEQALNSLRSQMLILLEQHEGVVVFATNLVTNFDRAFESRILKHIHIDLPNQEARAAIIRKMIPAKLPVEEAWTDEQLMQVSAEIEGLSGREIKNAMLDMLLAKACADGEHAVFVFDDLMTAFKNKKAQLEQLKKEEDDRIKQRIAKKLNEKAMEAQAEADMKSKEQQDSPAEEQPAEAESADKPA